VRYTTLGRSGLKVSEACLGTMNFGTAGGVGCCDEAEATRIVGAFLDAGHNFIDTADAYTGGDSERIVGRAIRGRREAVVLATKAFLPQGPGPNDTGLSRAHLVKALDASLRRLNTDYIDVYQCHQPDADTPIEETMATLDGFVGSGKVRYLGCSNFTTAQIVEAQWAAQRLNITPFISLQPQYSLLNRSIEPEILPACQRHGLGVIAWSPLGGGVLTGRYRRGTVPDVDTRIGRLHALSSPTARAWAEDLLNDRNLDIADEVTKTANTLDTSPTAVALAWVRQRPGVTSIIIGPRTLGQLDGNLAGFDLTLPPEAAAHLDDVSWSPTLMPVTGMGARR
jgi:aryl-alcohol dehydrogenase-like predicted oxidoreductase